MLSLDPHRDSVIVVDVQNDFCPGGALPVPEGDKVIPPLNALLGRASRGDPERRLTPWVPPRRDPCPDSLHGA